LKIPQVFVAFSQKRVELSRRPRIFADSPQIELNTAGLSGQYWNVFYPSGSKNPPVAFDLACRAHRLQVIV
jgi:hypothetical protein